MLIKTLERKRLALIYEMNNLLEFIDYHGLKISCRAREKRMSYQVCDLTLVIRRVVRHSSRVWGYCQMRRSVESSNLLLAAFKGSRAWNANHSWNLFHLLALGTREINEREGTQLHFGFIQHLLSLFWFIIVFPPNLVVMWYKTSWKTNCYLEYV